MNLQWYPFSQLNWSCPIGTILTFIFAVLRTIQFVKAKEKGRLSCVAVTTMWAQFILYLLWLTNLLPQFLQVPLQDPTCKSESFFGVVRWLFSDISMMLFLYMKQGELNKMPGVKPPIWPLIFLIVDILHYIAYFGFNAGNPLQRASSPLEVFTGGG